MRVCASVTGQSNRTKCDFIVDQSVLDPKWTGNGFPFNCGDLMRSTFDEAGCARCVRHCVSMSFRLARLDEVNMCAHAHIGMHEKYFFISLGVLCVCVCVDRSVGHWNTFFGFFVSVRKCSPQCRA